MEGDTSQIIPSQREDLPTKPHKGKTIWSYVFTIGYIQLTALYGLYLAPTAKWQTIVFAVVLYLLSMIGTTAGAHRLWSHRSYKANLPLRILIMVFFQLAFEGTIFSWARDHRVHHKYQETDADPYNARRGLWFSHVGWVLETKNPLVFEKGNNIDLSDLRADAVVMFQRKYIYPLLFLSMTLPTIVPLYYWSESFTVAWHVGLILRLAITHNCIWTINSLAHKYGSRPYDVNLFATQNKFVSLVATGEGWHNYHHAFPWDYKAAELGNYSLNIATGFIDLFAKLGWAYDLKTVEPEMVKKRALRTGDGSHEANLWGWGDADMTKEGESYATIDKGVDFEKIK